MKPGGDCLISFMTNNPIFEIYERLANDPKWSIYMEDVKKFVTPYQHSKNAVKEISDYLEKSMFTKYKVVERDRIFIYQNINILRGK